MSMIDMNIYKNSKSKADVTTLPIVDILRTRATHKPRKMSHELRPFNLGPYDHSNHRYGQTLVPVYKGNLYARIANSHNK